MTDTASAETGSGATLIDGKSFAANLREGVGRQVAALQAEHDLTPGLAVVIVGDNEASHVYVRSKAKKTVEAGMESFQHVLPAETSEADLLDLVAQLNNDDRVHGILVQLPLPDHMDADKVINRIDPAKDVDGFHVVNAGRLATGQRHKALVPCTPLGCLMLIQHHLGDLSGQHAVILGRSNIVGKPMSQLLLSENCTTTVAHSRTRDLPAMCRQGDILVAAVGRERMVTADWIKPGATVIDVGINRLPPEEPGAKGKLVGDVDFDDAQRVAGAITPVPGGVGPMTIAVLLANTVTAACRQAGVAEPSR
jgi:methylenetetrahydrofolate dehydrogenase (NADP+)/methenyltetrahydrofolate cyclohydrolase